MRQSIFASIVAGALCSGMLLHAQQPPVRSSAGTGDEQIIAGQVTSALDGHLIEGAEIQVADVKSRTPVASQRSDAEGHFRFTHLPAGKFSVSASRRGYMESAYQQHDQFSTAIVTGAALPTTTLRMQMTPLALLQGRVTDTSGEAVRNGSVTLFREVHDDRGTHFAPSGSALSDDLGQFEIPNLATGRFVVGVQAIPWYAVHARRTAGAANGVVAGGVDPSLDVAYPLTFYPGTANSEEATVLTVKGGERFRIDIPLTAVHAVTLTLPAKAEGEGEHAPRTMLAEEVMGVTRMIPSQGEEENGTVTFSGLAPGQYELLKFDAGSGKVAASTPIDLTSGPMTLATIPGTSSAAVSVTVHQAGGSPLPPKSVVVMQSGTMGSFARSLLDDKGHADMGQMRPGRYRVFVGSEGANGMLTSRMKVGGAGATGRTVIGNRLDVAAGESVTVDLTATAKAATIGGFAKRDSGGNGGAMVVLVPKAAGGDPEVFRRDQSDLDGSFVLPQVLPGSYTLIAIDDGWSLDWSNMDALAPYLRMGQAVNVPEDTTKLQLPDAVAIQPR